MAEDAVTSAPGERPAALVAPEVDLRAFPHMMVDLAWLLEGAFSIRSSGAAFKAALRLMGVAWRQTPAGSLPSDDRLLAYMSGAGAAWPDIRDEALEEFVLCSDGRLYHRTHSDTVKIAWARKLANKTRTHAASAARWGKKKGKPSR